jgi:hypothetical protein
MKDKKITELEIKEIKKELLEIQRSHLNESKGEQLEQLCTMNVGEQKKNLVPTAEEEMEYHQQRTYIRELKEKIESAYCHVTQIQINERPRLQKLQSMFQINEILKTATEAMAKLLKDKDLNLTEIIHLIYAAAMVITKEINGTGCYKLETQSLKTPPGVRCVQESIHGIRKELSSLAEIKRDEDTEYEKEEITKEM